MLNFFKKDNEIIATLSGTSMSLEDVQDDVKITNICENGSKVEGCKTSIMKY